MSRSDNQVCEEFFQNFKAHIVKGGLQSLTPVVHEKFKFLKFHSEQDRKELQFHMEPVITKMMWTLVERAHPMVMACAYSVTPGRHSAGASQVISNLVTGRHSKIHQKRPQCYSYPSVIISSLARSNAHENCSPAETIDKSRAGSLCVIAQSACN
jgi:hypothetical protein